MPKKATKVEQALIPDIFCVKCKSATENREGSAQFKTSKNGRKMVQTKCDVCETKKSRFLSKD